VHDISFDISFSSLTCRAAVSKRSYEAGFDTIGPAKQNDAVDEIKVSLCSFNTECCIDG
jgi:hypothetical protein